MELHLRRARPLVWVVVTAGLVHAVPALARVLADLHPVVLAVLDLARVLQSLGEQVTQVVIIGGILESEVPHIREVFAELLGETFAQVLNRRGLLLLANLLVLLLVGRGLEALPW